MSLKLSPYPSFFRSYWRTYRHCLSERDGGHSKKGHASPSTLWQLYGEDIRNAYIDTMSVIMEPEGFAVLQTLMRLHYAKRQRTLERQQHIRYSNMLPQLDDTQINTFICLARKRLQHSLRPPFKPRLIHRLLYELGLFTYSSHTDSLVAEEVSILALSSQLSGQVGGSRRELRRRKGILRPQRIRHPMLPKRSLRSWIGHAWHYFTGARIFLWISKAKFWVLGLEW